MVEVALWLFDHGLLLGWLAAGLALLIVVPLALLSLLSRGFLHGAKLIAAGWVWREAWRALSRRGGAGGHSALYQATMRSASWRRTRAQAIRRAGRRCAWCRSRGPLEGHHLTYARLGREMPGDVVALCKACHLRAHGR